MGVKKEHYDLYLDESGHFFETSANKAERRPQRFPSQLAGLLVPRDSLTEAVAEAVLANGFQKAGLALSEQVHAVELRRNHPQAYEPLLNHLLAEIEVRGWQPVRMVNQEQVSYGDRRVIYTNLVAELALRICRQKSKEGIQQFSLNLVCARVVYPSGFAWQAAIKEKDYLTRLREYFVRAAVWKGYAAESARWSLGWVEVESGRIDRRLQLCDLLSHASHDNYQGMSGKSCERLRRAFGSYDQTLALRELFEQVDELFEERSFGRALLALAGPLITGDGSADLQRQAQRRVGLVLDELRKLVAPVRNSQLLVLLTWLEQLIDLQHSAVTGYDWACWLQDQVAAPLQEKLQHTGRSGELTWFIYALHRWALTACNHQAALRPAKPESEAMEQLLPALAGRGEYIPLLIEGLCAQAVHLTDSFEFERVAQLMKLVIDHSNTFAQLLPQLCPEGITTRLRSDWRGKALGTWLQSEILAIVQTPALSSRLDFARQLSDQAIDEFENADDKRRQYQYRCQLELAAGNCKEARKYLALSLGLRDYSHGSIAKAIGGLEHYPVGQGFALLHWLRLGVRLLTGDAAAAAKSFLSVLDEAQLLESSWSAGQMINYPAHGILRRVAVIRAARGEVVPALAALKTLRNLVVAERQPTLAMITLAAYAETAALLWEGTPAEARRLLASDHTGEPGLQQLLALFGGWTCAEFPGLWRAIEPWAAVIEEVLQAESLAATVRAKLLQLGRAIDF